MFRTGPALGLALASLLAVRLPAWADAPALLEGRELAIRAERVDLDPERGTAVLQGDVEVTVGDLSLRCPAVELRYDRSARVESARGTGGVVARYKAFEATAPTLDLDVDTHELRLTGGVRLTHGRGWMTAERATIDTRTGKVALAVVKGVVPVDARKP